jgi:alkane 1-monooxygenase
MGPVSSALRVVPIAGFALAALLPVPLLAMGVLEGGGWLWLAFLYMGVLTILLDQLVPLVTGAAEEAEFPAADFLLVTIALALLAALPVTVWAITGESGLDRGERVLLFFAASFWFGQVGHPAAHELIHRPRRELFRLGAAVYAALLFGQHASAHRLVHHRHVATSADPNTARAGEGFYRFAWRAWTGSFRKGFLAENELRARGAVTGLHPYAGYLAGSAGALLLALLIGGPFGLLVWVLLSLHVQGQILLSDYVQHYGLLRRPRGDGRAEPVGITHSWNAPHWFSAMVMLNAPRHSDHHANPLRQFPALRLPKEDQAPTLPWPLPLACAIALVPGLWRRAIRPHLDRWRAPVLAAEDTRP